MKIKLIGMSEASVPDVGDVVRDQIVEVPDNIGRSLILQTAIWESAESGAKNTPSAPASDPVAQNKTDNETEEK